MNYQTIREECCIANRRLAECGLVDLTFGNVSVLDAKTGVFAIKPSGVDYESLRPADMVIVDLQNGHVVEGKLRPSSDTPTHRHLFSAFGDQGVQSVVHTHSRHAVAFAQAGCELPCFGTTHSDFFRGAIPVTRELTLLEVTDNYEWETGAVIIERFSDVNPLDIPAVLVRNHGPFAWGANALHAVETAQALEIVAQIAIDTLSISPIMSPAPRHLREKHFLRKHGPEAYYGQGAPPTK